MVALPQQEKPPAVLTPADQVAGLQPLVEVQLQHGLEPVCLVVLVDFERTGAGGGLPGDQVEPHIVHAGVEPSPVHGVGDPLVGPLVEQEGVQRRHIVVRRQTVQFGEPFADESPQRLADGGDVHEDFPVSHAVIFVKLPLHLQRPRHNQQGPGLFRRSWWDRRTGDRLFKPLTVDLICQIV